MSKMKSIIEGYLRAHPGLAENLKPNAAEGLAAILENTINPKEAYTERQGQIVNRRTNLAMDVEELFRTKGRPLLKTLSSGKFIPRFADRRHEVDKKKQADEVRSAFEEYLKKRPERYVNADIVRVLTEHVSENFIVERSYDGSFSFARLFKGQKIDSVSPEDIVRRISAYQDFERSEIEGLRQKAKFREEAIRLAGFTPEEARDSKKQQWLNDTIKKLEKEHYRQTAGAFAANKLAPSASLNDLKADLRLEYGHQQGLPIDPKRWLLNEMIQADAYGQNEIDADKARAWEKFEAFTRERTPDFYKTAREQFTGLEYEEPGPKRVPT